MEKKLDQQTVTQAKAEADRLITESQELFAQQKPAEAIQLLQQAYELDKNNSSHAPFSPTPSSSTRTPFSKPIGSQPKR